MTDDKQHQHKADAPGTTLSSPTCLLSELENPVATGYLSNPEIAELLAQTASDLKACRDTLADSDPSRAAALDAIAKPLATLRKEPPTVPDPEPETAATADETLARMHERLKDALLRLNENAALTARLSEISRQLARLTRP